jgi:hypothetical protein
VSRVIGTADNMEVSAPPGLLHFPAVELRTSGVFRRTLRLRSYVLQVQLPSPLFF